MFRMTEPQHTVAKETDHQSIVSFRPFSSTIQLMMTCNDEGYTVYWEINFLSLKLFWQWSAKLNT